MRIGNGPRLAIPRGIRGRRSGRWYWGGGLTEHQYNEELARRRASYRRLPHRMRVEAKSPVRAARHVADGLSVRLVDDHGRTYGPRLSDPRSLPPWTRVRVVARQEEDLNSLLSRMLTAAHRRMLRDN